MSAKEMFEKLGYEFKKEKGIGIGKILYDTSDAPR